MSAARYIRGTGRVLEFGNWVLNLASPLEDEIGIIEQSPELGRGVGTLDSYFYILTRTQSERRDRGRAGGTPQRVLQNVPVSGVK